MKKNLILGVILAVVILGVVLIVGQKGMKKTALKPGAPAKAAKPIAAVPAKKAITKGKGALTVKILDSKGKEMPLRIRAFKVIDSKSSVYTASFGANRIQELSPGNYDIEIDTIPQKIYKGVNVSEGRDGAQDLGHITGAVNVKVMNSKGRDASYPVKILYQKSEEVAATVVTNRPVEILPGVYDIDIATLPRQLKSGVRITAGKEELIDLGNIIGSILVRAVDENKKEVRAGVRFLKAETNEVVTTALANRPMEIAQGTYDIEISSMPKQTKKGVKVIAGSETNVEFTVEAARAPTPPPAPVKAKK